MPEPTSPLDAMHLLDPMPLRRDTPGIDAGIHLNHAGASLPPAAVHEAIQDHLALEIALGGYEAEAARQDEIAAAYGAMETLLGATPGSVALVENATAAFSQALSSIRFRPGDVLLTTRHDYVSNQLMALSLADRLGVEVVHAPDAPEGGVDTGAMIEIMHRRRPRLVTMTHIPTNSGLVQDPVPVAEAARARGIPFLLDACQSVGQMDVRVDQIPATFISGTARKFLRGPRGAGFLWIDPEALDAGMTPLFPDLRGADWLGDGLWQPAPDARRFENWEFPWALMLGMGAAAREAIRVGLAPLQARAWGLAARLRASLADLDSGVEVLDRGPALAAIVTFRVPDMDARAVAEAMRRRGVRLSVVDWHSAVLDFEPRGVEAAVRLSPHAMTLEAELDTAVGALAEVLAEGRS
jgi:selenocysteine lyase/cysteine desulfurase